MLALLDSGAAEATERPSKAALPMQTTQQGRRRLTKPAGLGSRKDFVRVQGTGQRFKGRLMVLLVSRAMAAPPHDDPSTTSSSAVAVARVGYTVSRKVGNAVHRNLVRRRLREVVRCAPEFLTATYEYVIIAFPGSATASFGTLREEALCLLKRAHGWASRQSCS